MNFKTLVSSLVVSLSLTAAASAQWSNSGTGINIGVGGSYGKYKVNETGPNGRTYSRTVTNNDLRWGVGIGSYSNTNSGYYGGGYGGGYGYGGGCYGGGVYAPAVMPYYGGCVTPVVVPYSPFTGCYGNPCYGPQIIAPAAYCPQFIVR